MPVLARSRANAPVALTSAALGARVLDHADQRLWPRLGYRW